MKLVLLILMTTAWGMAQTPALTGLQGLPDEGVLLTGTLEHPMLVNNTNRVIQGHLIMWVPGTANTVMNFRTKGRGGPDLLPPGKQIEVHRPGDVRNAPVQLRGPYSDSPITGAILGAVIFDDGEVVGPYAERIVQMWGSTLQAEKDVHQLAQHGGPDGWKLLESAARGESGPWMLVNDGGNHYAITFRVFADELVGMLTAPLGGMDMVMKTAHTSDHYPTLHVKK